MDWKPISLYLTFFHKRGTVETRNAKNFKFEALSFNVVRVR